MFCPHCKLLRIFEARLKKGEQLSEQDKVRYEKCKHHLKLHKHQMGYYMKIRKEVERDHSKVMIVQDFTRFYVGNKKINDLMICVLVWNAEKDKCEWLYYDYMEEGIQSKQDYRFVRKVWRSIFGLENLGNVTPVGTNTTITISDAIKDKKIYLFSDGGPGHFKNRYTLAFWAEL